ncbi:MAG TPA: hypothetical protein VLJ59_20020 [Mycobacteriales bacterium]|nr:hypothetical protein [Mycobacteriales bacterium]
MNDLAAPTAAPTVGSQPMNDRTVRSTPMYQIMYEELARSRMSEAQEEAETYRRSRRLIAARRWQRKAAQAARRARQAQNAIW